MNFLLAISVFAFGMVVEAEGASGLERYKKFPGKHLSGVYSHIHGYGSIYGGTLEECATMCNEGCLPWL